MSYRVAQYLAHAMVTSAIRHGELPVLKNGGIQCTDCPKPAVCYDHRDYLKPLDVDPVCHGCNIRRGDAAHIPYGTPVVFIGRRGKPLGRRYSWHSAMHYVTDVCGYARPAAIEPDDARAELQRQFVTRAAELQEMLKRLQR